MSPALHRPPTSLARVLPAPRVDWHALSAEASTPTWRQLHEEFDPQGLASWRRVTGWCGDARQRMQRLLGLHRDALAAETAGRWPRADFLWNEAHALLQRMWRRDADWNEVARLAGLDLTGAQLRILLRDELFVDGHAALANGNLEGPSGLQLGMRGFAHVRWISRLLELRDTTAGDAFDTAVRPALLAELALMLDAHRYDEAIARLRGEARLARTPDLLDRLAQLIFQRALGQLSDEPAGHEKQDAASLARNIRELEAIRKSHPDRLLPYDLLARLSHMHSVCLGNSGRLADAMVASARASALAPGFELAEQAMTQLGDNMRALQEKMRIVEQEVRSQHGRQLNAEGMRLKAEAQRGFVPLNRFRKSGEAERLAAARRDAEAAAAAAPAPEPSANPGLPAAATFSIPPAQATKDARIPALRWWFGTQDVGTRALAGAAFACAAVAVTAATLESHGREMRDEAVYEIRHGSDQEPEPVMAAAERFLSTHPLTGSDTRRAEVEEAYARAFTEWFAQQQDSQSDVVRQHAARYRALVKEGGQS